MAGLFKNRIIRDKLEKFEIPDLEQKLDIVRAWHKASLDGSLKEKTETQCEQAFNSDFFVKVLSYEPFPNEVYTIQPKDNVETGGGQMPDATLGYFTGKQKRVVAVVEIKDANTSLDKSQHREGNLSPIQQAFKYKPQYKDCGFVIATNFTEIRLFRDNQLDYEKFTLDELVDAKNDYFQFRKFLFLLSAQNFVNEQGQTETEKLLSAIRVEQEKITAKFYKEYKKLREDLIKDIVANNKNIKRPDFYTHIVEKAQKLVDRTVFICFFEDSGLLPEGRLAEVVEYAQKGALNEPIWETIKKFFKAVDEGSAKLGVPDGYNGELFKQDEDLNKLIISDEICKSFVDLTKFDFEEDLSVNILGHIFEQSITDLEKLRDYSENVETETKKDEKRKKDGIFYTPEYIVDHIVRNSLGQYLQEKEQEVFKKHKVDSRRIKSDATHDKRLEQAYTEYQIILQDVKVLDPACGSGAFLVKVFDFLLAENKRVADILAEIQGAQSLLSTDDYVKSLLQNNIYGVDLNPESVEITKLSLWFKSAKKGQKLITLKNNIKCGNSLIDDGGITARPFDWNKEFSEIMSKGGFDVVVGNPPYVQLSKVVGTTKEQKEYLIRTYGTSGGRLNTFIFFIHLASALVRQGGYVGFIVPNTLLTQQYYWETRKLLSSDLSLTQIVTYPYLPFSDAVVENITFIAVKGKTENITIYSQLPDDLSELAQISNSSIGRDKKYIIDIRNNPICQRIDSLNFTPLKDLVNINQAIALKGDKSLSVKDHYRDGYFKLIDGRNINRYSLNWSGEYLEYDLNRIHSCKTKDIFLQPKLLFRRVSADLIFTYDSEDFFALNTLVVLTPKEGKTVNLFALLAILNSKLINYYYVNKYKSTKKVFSEIQARTVGLMPIPELSAADTQALGEKARKLLELNKSLNSGLAKSLELFRHELNIEKLPNKASNFDLLTYDTFISLLDTELPISRKAEFMDFFNSEKAKLSDVRAEIRDLEESIDEKVFYLYSISEKEKDML